MRHVRYTASALKELRRHGNVARRIVRMVQEYAETGAHATNVTQLVGSTAWRMRVGDFRVIFDSDDDAITVTRVGPRGGVYD